MTLECTAVNGEIVLGGAPSLPEAARVRVELAGHDPDDIAPPPTGETNEECLASLRQGIEDVKAGGGVRGAPIVV
jgi:hypothetical protein